MAEIAGSSFFLLSFVHYLVRLSNQREEQQVGSDLRDDSTDACRKLIRLINDAVHLVELRLKIGFKSLYIAVLSAVAENYELISAESCADTVLTAAAANNACELL